jgi:hypothetical protein
MTEPLSLDELASAYLDGEVTPAERQAAEADPAVRARVEELRAVRALLLRSARPAPPSFSSAERDAAVAGAVAAAAGESGNAGRVEPDAAGHDEVSERRVRQRHETGHGRRRVLVALATAAAAVVVAAGAVTVARRTSSTTSALQGEAGSSAVATASPKNAIAAATTLAPLPIALTPASRPATDGDANSATTGAAAAVPAPTPATTPANRLPGEPALVDLGVLTDAASVRRAVTGLPGTTGAATPDPCSLAPARVVARASWNGIAAYVYVDDHTAVVVAGAGCQRLAEVSLP